jgi:hypothetical protein
MSGFVLKTGRDILLRLVYARQPVIKTDLHIKCTSPFDVFRSDTWPWDPDLEGSDAMLFLLILFCFYKEDPKALEAH